MEKVSDRRANITRKVIKTQTKGPLDHHHQPRPPLLHIARLTTRPAHAEEIRLLVHRRKSVAFAKVAAADLVVVVAEDDAARRAREAPGVEFEALVRFKILALDAAVAAPADGVVELVVVVLAVGEVFVHVEFRRGEWAAARLACETFSVVTAR